MEIIFEDRTLAMQGILSEKNAEIEFMVCMDADCNADRKLPDNIERQF